MDIIHLWDWERSPSIWKSYSLYYTLITLIMKCIRTDCSFALDLHKAPSLKPMHIQNVPQSEALKRQADQALFLFLLVWPVVIIIQILAFNNDVIYLPPVPAQQGEGGGTSGSPVRQCCRSWTTASQRHEPGRRGAGEGETPQWTEEVHGGLFGI